MSERWLLIRGRSGDAADRVRGDWICGLTKATARNCLLLRSPRHCYNAKKIAAAERQCDALRD